MKIIGITGNSGSGKSTISKLISKNYEAKIIDADKIAKEMTNSNGEYLQAIRQAFGNDVIKNNELDRKKLADIVFLNRAEKEKLDGLTFEYVVEEIKKELETNQNLDYQYIILDVPLLFESKLDELGIRHKLIKPYTPRHNGKVERSHRKDQERFYYQKVFCSFEDLVNRAKYWVKEYNNFPMRPLKWLSPKEKYLEYIQG